MGGGQWTAVPGATSPVFAPSMHSPWPQATSAACSRGRARAHPLLSFLPPPQKHKESQPASGGGANWRPFFLFLPFLHAGRLANFTSTTRVYSSITPSSLGVSVVQFQSTCAGLPWVGSSGWRPPRRHRRRQPRISSTAGGSAVA